MIEIKLEGHKSDTVRIKVWEADGFSVFKGNNGADVYWKTPYFYLELKVPKEHPLYRCTPKTVKVYILNELLNSVYFDKLIQSVFEKGKITGRNELRGEFKELMTKKEYFF